MSRPGHYATNLRFGNIFLVRRGFKAHRSAATKALLVIAYPQFRSRPATGKSALRYRYCSLPAAFSFRA